MSLVARRALVHGHVQGVAFRHHTKVLARDLGLTGWVRNVANGDVEAWVEGEERPVETILAWLEKGPPAARVTRLEVETVAPAGHVQFKVRFD
jgi:acylphosphatase